MSTDPSQVRGAWGQGQSRFKVERSGQGRHTSRPLKASRVFIVHVSFLVGVIFMGKEAKDPGKMEGPERAKGWQSRRLREASGQA